MGHLLNRGTLAPIFRSQMLFGTDGASVGAGLSLVTCRRTAGGMVTWPLCWILPIVFIGFPRSMSESQDS